MARIIDRRKAIELRQEGKSWSYIKNILVVSKSTLSRWIKDVELTQAQRKNIFENSKIRRIENYIVTVKARRKRIEEEEYKTEFKNLGYIENRDLLVAGLFLYLGEGSKSNRHLIGISNSNPKIIRFAKFWLTKILLVPENKLRMQLHLYQDMDIAKEVNFWSKSLCIPKRQIIKPYIKKTSSKVIDHPTFGHGTCNIYLSNTILKGRIMASIKVILDSTTGRIV